MKGRATAVLLGLLSGLASITVASADGSPSGVVHATVQVDGGLDLTLRLADHSVQVGEETDATATVTNHSARALIVVRITLQSDGAGISVRGSRTRIVPVLWPGMSRRISWEMCARQPGNYLFVASASVAMQQPKAAVGLVQSNSELLIAKAGRQRCDGRSF